MPAHPPMWRLPTIGFFCIILWILISFPISPSSCSPIPQCLHWSRATAMPEGFLPARVVSSSFHHLFGEQRPPLPVLLQHITRGRYHQNLSEVPDPVQQETAADLVAELHWRRRAGSHQEVCLKKLSAGQRARWRAFRQCWWGGCRSNGVTVSRPTCGNRTLQEVTAASHSSPMEMTDNQHSGDQLEVEGLLPYLASMVVKALCRHFGCNCLAQGWNKHS